MNPILHILTTQPEKPVFEIGKPYQSPEGKQYIYIQEYNTFIDKMYETLIFWNITDHCIHALSECDYKEFIPIDISYTKLNIKTKHNDFKGTIELSNGEVIKYSDTNGEWWDSTRVNSKLEIDISDLFVQWVVMDIIE